MRLKLSTSALGLATLLALCLAPSRAAPRPPVQGRFSGLLSFEPTPQAGVLRMTGTATGIVSRMGAVNADIVVPEISLDPTTLTVNVGNTQWFGTIRAANGDEIRGEYQFDGDTFTIDADGDLLFTAQLQIISGTGRFQGVTGTAAATGVANLQTLRFSTEIRGEMSTGNRSQR